MQQLSNVRAGYVWWLQVSECSDVQVPKQHAAANVNAANVTIRLLLCCKRLPVIYSLHCRAYADAGANVDVAFKMPMPTANNGRGKG